MKIRKHLVFRGDFTLPSPSVSCFVGENAVEGLPRPLTQSLFVTFYDLQGKKCVSDLAAPPQGNYVYLFNISEYSSD